MIRPLHLSASKSTSQFLARYAEPEAQAALDLVSARKRIYSQALLIPVYDEQTVFFNGIRPALREDCLTVLIFNAPSDSTSESLAQSQNSLQYFVDHGKDVGATEDNRLQLVDYQGFSLLLVDRTASDRLIPKKQGVGLARKIGADIICQLFVHDLVSSPWIYSTDADVVLPSNYFQHASTAAGYSAMVFPFRHTTENNQELNIANVLYETKLHYYVAGLNYANSPYAFHTIGSTMAFHADTYAMARGFPKRAGGEDFYLLNKLVKLAPLKTLDTPTIEIQARESHRVPFGTGPALTEIQRLENSINDYKYYHPHCFNLLKLWLDSFNAYWNIDTTKEDNFSKDIFKKIVKSSSHEKNRDRFFEALVYSADFFKLDTHIKKLKQQTGSKEKFLQQMHVWFDGFKTLKFIHTVRDEYFPSINLDILSDRQDFFPQANTTLRRLQKDLNER